MIWDIRYRGFGSKIIFIWFMLDIVLSILIWAYLGIPTFFIYYTSWLAITYLSHVGRLRNFVFGGILLAVIEETIVYFLGGGLGGEARSLVDDYLGSIPMFIGLIVGWWLFLKEYEANSDTVLFLSGLQGFLIEIIFTGIIFNPPLTFFFGGAVMYIYSSIICTPLWPKGFKKADSKKHFRWFIFSFILGIIGGLIGSILRTFYKPIGYII